MQGKRGTPNASGERCANHHAQTSPAGCASASQPQHQQYQPYKPPPTEPDYDGGCADQAQACGQAGLAAEAECGVTSTLTGDCTSRINEALFPMFQMMSVIYRKPGQKGPPGCKGPDGKPANTLSCAQIKQVHEKVCEQQVKFAQVFTTGFVDACLSDVDPTSRAFDNAYNPIAKRTQHPWEGGDATLTVAVQTKLIDSLIAKDGHKGPADRIMVARTKFACITETIRLVHCVLTYKDGLFEAELIATDDELVLVDLPRHVGHGASAATPSVTPCDGSPPVPEPTVPPPELP
jgi:hypothetical protein